MAKNVKNTSNASDIATLNMREAADLIAAVGEHTTVLVEGDMGSGKTSLIKLLAQRFPSHHAAYFDCTNKDVGDLYLPDIMRVKHSGVTDCVRFLPNEEFGLHTGKPVVLMLDEIGKNRSIINPLLRVMQEHSVGNVPLPAGSLVFATTNLGAENVGDMLPAHARNRIMRTRMAKPTAEEWITWGTNNDISPVLMAAVKQMPQMLQSFTEVKEPADNPYIYDPRDASRTAFVTPRSLEKASRLLDARAQISDNALVIGLIGLVGAKAAMDLKTYIEIGDKLTTYEEIVRRPAKAPVPDNVAAGIMIALTCAMRVEQADFDAVFEYMQRLPLEMMPLFMRQAVENRDKSRWLATTKTVTDYAAKHHLMF